MSATTTHDREVVVIGGGQAGLAIGYHLAEQGRRFTILEAAGEPAAAWRGRWDSLELFTPVRYDSLPGLAFPGELDSYPGRDDVVAYLTNYARHFDLPIELNSRVRSVRARDGRYVVELSDRTYEADQVVVATGPFQMALTPAIAKDLGGDVLQLHSSAYRSPIGLPDGPVLVVGGGNTGFQIAAELVRSHETHLAVGSRQTPLPQCILRRDLFRYLEASGLMRTSVTSRLGSRMKDRDTLIGSSPRAARRQGIQLHARATRTAERTVTFADGSELEVATVVWATGFTLDHTFVELPVFDDDGAPVHTRGVTREPGLYFLGLPWQHTRGSALLGWIKDDARYIADEISALATDRSTLRPSPAAALPESAPR